MLGGFGCAWSSPVSASVGAEHSLSELMSALESLHTLFERMNDSMMRATWLLLSVADLRPDEASSSRYLSRYSHLGRSSFSSSSESVMRVYKIVETKNMIN